MQISKTELIKALDTIKPGLASTEDIAQTTSFAFLKDRIVTYNDSISISYPFESGLECAISAKELYSLLNKLDGKKDLITVNEKENELILTYGKRVKAGIKIKRDVLLPLDELKLDEGFKKVPKDLIEALNFCSFSTAKGHDKPLLTCIHVKGNKVQSTDNFRATSYIIDKKIKEFLIPASVVRHLKNFKATGYALNENWVSFRTQEGAVFSSRIFNQEYPKLDPLFEMKGNKIKFPQGIEKAIQSAVIFSTKDTEMEMPVVQVILSKNLLTVKGEGEIGWFTEKTKIKYTGESFSFYIASDFFLDMLKLTDNCYLDKDTHKIKFSTSEFEHVCLLSMEE